MYDTIYNFIVDYLIDSTAAHSYLDDLAEVMTHVSMWLIYVVLIALLVHVFNAFRSMTRFW